MTHPTKLCVRRSQSPGEPSLHIESPSGTLSLGGSPDGSVSVALLGTAGKEEDAAALAGAFVAAGRNPEACAGRDQDIVILDHAAGRVSVVVAPIGLRQVYWTTEADQIDVASNPRTLLSNRAKPPKLRPEVLFQYLYFHMVPSPSTIHSGVSKLSGGHRLEWNGGEAIEKRYWRPRFDDVTELPETQAREELHQILQEAVNRALSGREDVGAFLSGGLDSSTVAGFAARTRPAIATVSMGFEAEGYDEMEYARIASRRFGTTPLEYYVTPEDVLETLPRIAAAFPEPFGNSSAAAAFHCARIAREHGIGLLLAGDGGDEIFGGNDRYAFQLVFEHYARVPVFLRKYMLEPAVAAVGRFTRAFPIGKAMGYVRQANTPLPDRLQAYNFLHRHDPAEIFSPDLLEQVDTSAPLRALREEYAVPDTSDPINRMLFLDWKFTLHDNDLVKVNTMCDLAGVEVAYPMLDQALVDFSRRLPGEWKVRNGQLRWFYKRAMQGFLPDEIINKTKHGFGLPFGVWTRTHPGLQRLSQESLDSLSTRGYFRPEFLREAMRLHREGHASYYGELVWILMVLELWLQAHHPDARL